MYPEILAHRKRILAKVMAAEDLELLRLVETLLDRPFAAADTEPEQVGVLVSDVLRALTGSQTN